MQVVAHEEALTILARCIDPSAPTSMLEAVKLFAAICLVQPDWYGQYLDSCNATVFDLTVA